MDPTTNEETTTSSEIYVETTSTYEATTQNKNPTRRNGDYIHIHFVK